MHPITDLMAGDHRACDGLFAAVERAVARGDWHCATNDFRRFAEAMARHFAAEEDALFPLFEQRTGIYRGPTQVMRGEHGQMRQLLAAAESALAAQDAEDYAGHAETLLIMMQQHNIKEEHILYPMCDDRLGDETGSLLPELQRRTGGGQKDLR
ncbi:hemerythrin domain-containing protein [Accumulibacter sp.]|uniref:hemerythrin domain-containing protein n=1 Tax=Accumulibacter sp. TaxID=2053492 RepID=UPI0025EDFA02|nr:hemerythrin domain-containing protein [Accumulibacter sp.]MCM8595067.1 hemerythrin domain-containing protein [Accumulibacter sp.]MCM8625450.1 hemerythrin domain-containing protein [Accumulibacter sp.]MDS4049213.1 hemerythrin domain-containing protein [Accumulibacter sp.]